MDFTGRARDRMTVAEMMRQVAKGLSIKFIAVIGLAGAGKSSIIKTLTGKDVHIEHSINAGTTSFGMFPAIIDDQRYVFIDTPGFDDPHPERTNLDVFEEILTWFRTMSPYCNLTGVLYIHDIKPDRFSASMDLNLEMLKSLCGESFFPNITMITTKWGDLRSSGLRRAERRQKELESGPWKDLLTAGARAFKHGEGVGEPHPDDTPMGLEELEELEEQTQKAHEELRKIMLYYKSSKDITPEIQRELRRKVGILNTKAGTVLRKARKLPPTPECVDSEGNSTVCSPGWTNDRSCFLQAAPPAAIQVRRRESEPLLEKKERKWEGDGDGDQPPKSWWQNLVRVIRWFFLRRR
ncbi:hypothetical protein K440DRAFT_613982 [Wilcoxina mikolae CBS 423.85]|nr:hypothetical protein K440DRAFT_613982 [Wilcoxina mikolae CBS 423.85]